MYFPMMIINNLKEKENRWLKTLAAYSIYKQKSWTHPSDF